MSANSRENSTDPVKKLTCIKKKGASQIIVLPLLLICLSLQGFMLENLCQYFLHGTARGREHESYPFTEFLLYAKDFSGISKAMVNQSGKFPILIELIFE